MNLTPRLRKILLILLEKDTTMSVQELAERVGVSKRTVQRELEYLGNELDAYGISFESRTGKGVWLSGDIEQKKKLQQELCRSDDYDVSDREDRRKRLLLEILKDKGLKKLFYYADLFQVSEATVSSDLESVEGWLEEHGLKVTRKPGSGTMISGSEENYRKAIRVFIEENIDTRTLREAYDISESEKPEEISYHSISWIFKEDVLKKVTKCISGMNNRKILSLTENSYVGLVLHITIAINRILKNEIIETKEELLQRMEKDEDFLLAEEIVARLEEEFAISIPEIEKAYICLHIKGAKHQGIEWDGAKTVEIERQELLEMMNEMIDAYDKEAAFVLKQDNEFIQGLLAHLQPTLIRLIYDMKIANPVLEEIKSSYPDIFEKSKNVARVLEKWVQRPVPEEETGFLAVHFGAAMVRMEGKQENLRRVRVGIVCASGIGISRLMLSKLDKMFKDRLWMETYGKNDITPYIISKTDFFISSISMKNVDADILWVNPLLNDEDIDKIGQKLYYYERLPRKEQEETLFSTELEQINLLAMQIKTIIRYLEVFKVSNDVTFGELVEAIARKMSPYGDRQAMIQADIEEREKIASQVFAEFGFALLHTRTKGVMRPSFSVCLTKDGKAFKDPYFKGISVVLVMLLPVDENIRINSDILGYISSSLIEDYDFLLTITGGDKPKIEEELSKQLRKYFNKCISQMQ